jgi:flagellar L-ring protein precursor FlgH
VVNQGLPFRDQGSRSARGDGGHLRARTASNQATTQNSKSSKLYASGGTGPLKFLDAMGGATTSDFEGDGTTSRVTSLHTHITARFMDVLPNGNLVIEGRRMNQINDEVQEMYLKGIVRPVDIAADNTVQSTALGEAEIKLSGSGPGARVNRPGPLQRVFDWVF